MASAQDSSAGHLERDSSNSIENKEQVSSITETDGWPSRLPDLDPAVEYRMNNRRRGLALIFNHEDFFWHLRLNSRQGTNADSKNLFRTLKELGFDVQSYYNLKTVEVLDKIHEASTQDHSDADCFLCVFLSHGEDNHVYSYDSKIDIQTLTDPFKGDKCKSLIGKPKIFIIQAIILTVKL
ncbi:hypothetical protein GDO86_000625 [Hymenochirus boettgeri]|uniref:Caspase family p20 domain-containing protein n=1 Tax=Hymenochirus boettgeri TaxID=247094 RepID=A0A8T2KBM8_9PIPI|nr:hypothetical protein GDO86_000625 [Hymenochirus boettgeri]